MKGVIKMFAKLIESVVGRAFSPDSAAALLELSRSQIHRLIKNGKLQAIKLGSRTTRIPGESIAAYLQSKESVERAPVCVKKPTRSAASV